MKKEFFSSLMLVMGLLVFVQCSSDPEPIEESFFENGVFIVNEGNYTDSDGSLSYYDFDSLKLSNQVFEAINDRPLAAVFQSMRFYNSKGYIIDSNGRIEIVNEKDLTSAGTINSGLIIPRYFEGYSNYGYLTDWGPYDDNYGNPESKILVFDLDAKQLAKEIEAPSRPEGIVVLNDMIYVANSATNLVTIYDPATNSLKDSIEVNNGPTHFAVDKNQGLWLVSTGAYITGGALQQIDAGANSVVKTVDISNTSPNGKLVINGDGDLLFFMGEQWAPDYSYTENKVYKASISRPDDYTEIISARNLYGLGVDPVNDEIYVADAVAFQGNGKIYTYDFTGEAVNEFSVGRGPRDFVFMVE
jgi:YVTN family beta-propeller protein